MRLTIRLLYPKGRITWCLALSTRESHCPAESQITVPVIHPVARLLYRLSRPATLNDSNNTTVSRYTESCLWHAIKAQWGSRGIGVHSLNTRWGCVVNGMPRLLFPLYRRLGGRQSRSERLSGRENLLAPFGFEPRTVEPVGSHRTDHRYPGPQY